MTAIFGMVLSIGASALLDVATRRNASHSIGNLGGKLLITPFRESPGARARVDGLDYDALVFTGIIERIGEVRGVAAQSAGRRLSVACTGFWEELAAGASVAVDGVCLTIAGRRGDTAEFDVIHETLSRSTLGELQAGSRVNLERSLQAGARLDGHFVQGHVDAVATIARIERSGGEARWTFALDSEPLRCVIPKGGVAVDGISLTVTNVTPGAFSVALIPTTLERTTLGGKTVGARVNIETDILSRTIVHALQSIIGRAPGLSIERLKELGFA
jgi:riboflavin synthase